MRLAVSRYFPSFEKRCEKRLADVRRVREKVRVPTDAEETGRPRVLDVNHVEDGPADAPSHHERFVIREMGNLTTCRPSSSRNSMAVTSIRDRHSSQSLRHVLSDIVYIVKRVKHARETLYGYYLKTFFLMNGIFKSNDNNVDKLLSN